MKPQYRFLLSEKSPKILIEALKLYGTKEVMGKGSNPVIISWAVEIGGWVQSYYKSDDIPWCGLFMGVVAKRAGFPFNQKILTAAAWQEWGVPVLEAMLGDVLIFTRRGGGHVGIYVGEDDDYYHVLGGNQADAVSIVRIHKDRLTAVRRCRWKFVQPKNVRKIVIKPIGAVSENEA